MIQYILYMYSTWVTVQKLTLVETLNFQRPETHSLNESTIALTFETCLVYMSHVSYILVMSLILYEENL